MHTLIPENTHAIYDIIDEFPNFEKLGNWEIVDTVDTHHVVSKFYLKTQISKSQQCEARLFAKAANTAHIESKSKMPNI